MNRIFGLLLVLLTIQVQAQKLPHWDKNKQLIQKDWLVDNLDAKAAVYETTEGHIVFSNGLVSRTFSIAPNCATINLELLTKDENFLRSVRPEAEVEIDGIKFPIGGLTGQPVHNYLLKEWVKDMKAIPSSFKLKDYKIEETKARFPWKKRLEWMPKDMPWPAPGKELIFSYQLNQEALNILVAGLLKDDNRPVLFTDKFEKLSKQWKRFESKSDDRNSFINEGKSGEIMALANSAVYADRKWEKGTKVVMAKINPGTDKGVSWGPGLGLVFKNQVVKVNLRPNKRQFGFYDGEHEKVIGGMKSGKSVWLRMELTNGKLIASYSYDKDNWTKVGATTATNKQPTHLRVGKMDWAGKNSDHGDKGRRGRCHVEQVEMLGAIPRSAQEAGADKFNYLKDVTVKVHYELYDNMPLFCKWITVENNSGKEIVINTFKSEILAAVEPESTVDPREKWRYPNITVETDYVFGGMSSENILKSSIAWNKDPEYKTQVNYSRITPCLLEAYPKYGPDQEVIAGGKFESFRTWELLNDSWDAERKGLEHRKLMRAMAPWITENPIFMHVRSAKDEAVKLAVDQCAEVGFEKVIMTFGSGFNAEDASEANISRMKKLTDYAHSKGVTLGGYSLLASRRVKKGHNVVMPEGMRPRFGNSPCIESEWGHEYFKKLYNLYEKTGMDNFEHDGSYPGDVCASTNHPGHKGLADSQWKQYKRIADFYKWCRAKGIYLNVPDYYFLSGSSKTGMGYRETNWSLPRAQQEIIERQNIYDGTWHKTPSMGWMFVPLVQYHGGGAAATIEPLKEHLPHYGQRMANLFGAGVQAIYRGPKLYDSPQTKALVKKWVNFYKKHRQILDADIIHIRRPDGRDYDAILHVDPKGKEKGLLMVYNPLTKPIKRKIKVNLYYTGLKNKVRLMEQDKNPSEVTLDRDYNAVIEVTIPAKSQTWFTMQ
ncbi:hypothetical protein EMN47_05865 [Prolixibacteraceae bacterium JC049]|nr:hypothetical protein [Prolixibacteraceae bacterium JC049]